MKLESRSIGTRTGPGRLTGAVTAMALILTLAGPLAAPVAADAWDEGFDDGFSDGFDEGFDEGFDDGFDEGFGTFGARETSLSWSGFLRFDTRAMIDTDNPHRSALSAHPDLALNLTHESSRSELVANLRFRPALLEEHNATASGGAPPSDAALSEATLSDAAGEFARELIDEAHITLFYDRFRFQAGYAKQVWGTGDQIHVVDVINSEDLRDFINPDYRERRIARPMARLVVPVGTHGRWEAVYVPTFAPDRIPRQGPWTPPQLRELEQAVGAAVATPIAPANDDAAAAARMEAAAWAAAVVEEPDTGTLEWGQAALRYRDTAGPLDFGLIYYYGFLKQPSLTFALASTAQQNGGADPGANVLTTLSVGDRIILNYDRVHVIGIELAAVLGGFNTRAEAAWYITEDVDGDDPAVTNNSVRYLAGFDRDIPVSSLNLNIQGLGAWTLGSDRIDRNVEKRGLFDFQYDPRGRYRTHTVSAALTDRLFNERVLPEMALAWAVETEDLYLAPAVEFVLQDDVRLTAEGAFFIGDEGPFGAFRDNDFVQLRLEYRF